MLFGSYSGYDFNKTVFEKLNKVGAEWREGGRESGHADVTISNSQMLEMHMKALEISKKYVGETLSKKDIYFPDVVRGIEQYLSENVRYDYDGLKNYRRRNLNISNLDLGTNSTYNAIIGNCCVCEGYTRAMQYLLILNGISSRNVHCYAGEDKIGMADNDSIDDPEKIFYKLKKLGHSIICISDGKGNEFYDDPCWNACCYQQGDKTMRWTLLTKEEIKRDHTLTFVDKKVRNVSNDIAKRYRFESESDRDLVKKWIEERKEFIKNIDENKLQSSMYAGMVCDDDMRYRNLKGRLKSKLIKLNISESLKNSDIESKFRGIMRIADDLKKEEALSRVLNVGRSLNSNVLKFYLTRSETMDFKEKYRLSDKLSKMLTKGEIGSSSYEKLREDLWKVYNLQYDDDEQIELETNKMKRLQKR